MVNVFLSYDRDDAGKAKAVAAALEKAGHAVWWDKHINSGTQYSKAIEQALESADAVVVLWSAHAVESPWVRDEAAAGRDRGCLVPATLDKAQPPLGFRQFQSTDLSQWKGRGQSPQLRSLIDDVAAVAAARHPVAEYANKSVGVRNDAAPPRRLGPMVAAGAVLILAMVAAWWWFRAEPANEPTVSVLAADASPSSRQLADAVRIALGDLHSSGPTNMRLLDPDDSSEADLQVKVRQLSHGEQAAANVTLTSQADQAILWSKSYDAQGGVGSNLREVVAASIGSVLGCATEPAHGRDLARETRQLYLKACAANNEGADAETLIPQLRRITADAPRFAPAWAHLLAVEASAIRHSAPWSDSLEERAQLLTDVRAAKKFWPDLPELKLAEEELSTGRSMQESLEFLSKQVSAYPDNSNVLSARSEALAKVGAMSAATADARTAAKLNRFSPALLAAYIRALIFEGKTDEARAELRAAKIRWPAVPALQSEAARLELRYGDFVKALALTGARMDGGIMAYIKARSQPSKGSKDAFVELARTHEMNPSQKRFLIEALPGLDRVEDLFGLIAGWPTDRALTESTELLFSPWTASLRRDPRFIDYARRVGLLDYWQSTGDWPDFCSEPDMPYNCKAEAQKRRFSKPR